MNNKLIEIPFKIFIILLIKSKINFPLEIWYIINKMCKKNIWWFNEEINK